jgi:IMP dehydrogenase
MRFLHPHRDVHLELSLDDCFLVPSYFDGTTRLATDLTPADLPGGSQPVVSANMNAVTGRRMAESMARLGGLGVLPQDMDLGTVERIVAHVKGADQRYDTPLAVTPGATLRDVQGIIRKRAHDLVVVIDEERRPIGIVTQADLRDRDQYTDVSQVMSTAMVTALDGMGHREAFRLMEANRVSAVPVVDEHGRLAGVLTKDDAVRRELLAPSVGPDGRLMVGVALGIAGEVAERAARLAAMGVDVVVLDTAHGHQRRMLDAVRVVRDALPDAVPLVAGNVCTAEGAADLLGAGADVVKVNIGPGAMCTTRMQTAAGRPTFSAVLDCAREAHALGKHVWADGGVRAPRDVALYLAAGASRVMIGTLLAGTYESPGDIRQDSDGQLYKENHGMASARAVRERSAVLDPFEGAKKALFREGISGSRVYLRPGRESVGAIVTEIVAGLQSAFTYAGARTCPEYFERAVIGVQTPGGFEEGKPHGMIWR